jgi:tRNA/rRNA methyltransferase
VVFGPEKHGLTREDLSYCHLLVEIPTDARQPSMNLGQAVAVCLYELASRVFSAQDNPLFEALPAVQANPAHPAAGGSSPAATSGVLDLLARLIEQTMTAAGYSPRVMQAANRHDLRLLLRRMDLSPQDTRRILGLFRRVLWGLRGSADSGHERG